MSNVSCQKSVTFYFNGPYPTLAFRAYVVKPFSSFYSSSSSDSGSDNEDEKPRPASANVMSMPSFMSGGSSTAASSQPSMPSFVAPASTSMPSFNLPSKTSSAPPQGRFPAPPPPQRGTAPPAVSMPQFLNDDLQLSESDDDSD